MKFIGDASTKGSDLLETMSKVKQVFGDATGSVTGMANDMAQQFGAVKGVTLDAAANLGLVAQGAGLSAEAAAKMSIRLTRLADDASSFFNVPLDVALEKIRSGLVGEAEPLRAFGVLLSETAVKQQALAMGMKPVHGEFTEQEKVMARVEIITRGLDKAQGDHMRTMDGYANQIKKLSGQWENYKAQIGASMSGANATVMAEVQDKGIMAAIGKWTMNAVSGSGLQKTLGENTVQKAADAAGGVESGIPKGGAAQKMDPQAAWGARTIDIFKKIEADRFKANQFFGSAGAFGMMGNLGGMFANMNVRGELTKEIDAKTKQQNAWGGSHIMDTESFMKAAQEKQLSPMDETAKKQLDELIKCRDALQVLAGKQEGKATVKGMVVKGRES